MEYFVEQATTHREAEQKVRQKYGDHARIMHHRSIRMGGFLGLFSREGVEVTGYFSSEPRTPAALVPTSYSGGIQAAAAQAVADRPPAARAVDISDEKKKILGMVNGEKTIDTVLKEIRELRERITSEGAAAEENSAIGRIRELLEQNDFSPSYVRSVVERMRRELSVEELSDQAETEATVLEWIGESIHIHTPRSSGSPEIVVLVGPTGVGKTTTIAKLAAMYGLNRSARKSRDIRILTIDNYRIGARQQIETYGQIMDIPVSFVESADDMRKYLALYKDADMIFIDTIGKSPRDFRKLGEMNELLSMCGGRARVHLAMSATTKTNDIAEIATQFEPFKYEAVIVTKLDETTRSGNIISVLSDREKAISFVTDGQRVPQDIERATRQRLLMNLEGFSPDRGRIEAAFGGQ